MRTIQTIRSIVRSIYWELSLSFFTWFLTKNLPFLVKCLSEALYKEHHENIFFNSRVYDGMTRNDFKRGNLISFLAKLGAIRVPYSLDDDDGRGYFTGRKEDED